MNFSTLVLQSLLTFIAIKDGVTFLWKWMIFPQIGESNAHRPESCLPLSDMVDGFCVTLHDHKNMGLHLQLTTFNNPVVTGENQRCYVCIPNIGTSIADVIQIFPSGPSLPLCNGFQKDKKEYIRECPSSKYMGCLTQTNGTHITKTCSSFGVEDCKTANKIEYCYCKGQLCNGESVPVEEARPPVTPNSGSGDDDEDTEPYMEGSGSSEETARDRKSHVTVDDIGIEAPRPTTMRTSFTTVEFKKASASSAPKSMSHPYRITFLSALSLRILSLFCCD